MVPKFKLLSVIFGLAPFSVPAYALEIGVLMASMVMGATIVNLAHHHERPFHAIEGIEWPFLVLFFNSRGCVARADHVAYSQIVGRCI